MRLNFGVFAAAALAMTVALSAAFAQDARGRNNAGNGYMKPLAEYAWQFEGATAKVRATLCNQEAEYCVGYRFINNRRNPLVCRAVNGKCPSGPDCGENDYTVVVENMPLIDQSSAAGASGASAAERPAQ